MSDRSALRLPVGESSHQLRLVPSSIVIGRPIWLFDGDVLVGELRYGTSIIHRPGTFRVGEATWHIRETQRRLVRGRIEVTHDGAVCAVATTGWRSADLVLQNGAELSLYVGSDGESVWRDGAGCEVLTVRQCAPWHGFKREWSVVMHPRLGAFDEGAVMSAVLFLAAYPVPSG